MPAGDPTTGDGLLELLGLPLDTAEVQASLDRFARGVQPELNPDDENEMVDYVPINEIGLEFGFEDEAYVRGLDPALRREGPLLLSQVCFYGDTPRTHPFPHPLPWGLSFQDDRARVRKKLAAFEDARRSYRRDFWRLPKFDVSIGYGKESDRLETIFCYLPYTPWPAKPGEEERVASFTPEVFAALFGLRWSNPDLRARLAPLGYEAALPEVRSENVADLSFDHGLELIFAPGSQVSAAEKRFPKALAFAGVTFYASRWVDAYQWAGKLPMGLAFSDTQADLSVKFGAKPIRVEDEDTTGEAVWELERYTVSVLYSNLENRPLQVTMLEPGYAKTLDAPDEEEDDD